VYLSTGRNKRDILCQGQVIANIVQFQWKAWGLANSRLPPLQDTPPITTLALSQAVEFWHEGIQWTYYRRWVFDMKRFWHVIWRDFDIWFELTWRPVNSPFSFFFPYSFVHFSNLQCHYK
jgi:hypothetical protein